MVTDLLAAAAHDVLNVAGQEGFLEKKARARSTAMKAVLGAYPSTLVAYLETVKADSFASEMDTLIPLLAKKQSVMSDAQALSGPFVKAFAAFLRDELANVEVSASTSLGVAITRFTEEGALQANRHRMLMREMQTFIEYALNEQSATAQIATDIDENILKKLQKSLSKNGGIPHIVVNDELIGGMRLFENGKLKDASWRARVQEIFNAIG